MFGPGRSSNEIYEEERHRLWVQNGALEGPFCGNCGTAYLEKLEEFIFNGAKGKPSGKVGRKNGSVFRARSVRVIHKPCQGLPKARLTVSCEHRRQKKRDENFETLSLLANGTGLHDIRRILRTPRGETEPGMSRLYNRIFWLERTLLAYGPAQLTEWRKRVERQRIEDGKPYIHTRIAHGDICVGVNWQTKIDRKIMQLDCSVVHATIQPTSTLMNAIRERNGIIQRAGGRSFRVGTTYINGAAYNPRVLIALMNI